MTARSANADGEAPVVEERSFRAAISVAIIAGL